MAESSDYERCLAEARAYYAALKPVGCKALGATVHFPEASLNHLIFANGGVERDRGEQLRRFALLRSAIALIREAERYQTYEERPQTYLEWVNGKTTTNVWYKHYWTLQGAIDGRRVKVVLRQLGDEPVHFRSVYPG